MMCGIGLNGLCNSSLYPEMPKPVFSYRNCGSDLIGKLPIVFYHTSLKKWMFPFNEADISANANLCAFHLKDYEFVV